jgi:hypothetical protein
MNALKVTKWFGFSLFCLVILACALALVGLGIAQDIQDRSSRPELIQEEGEQIDLLLPDQNAPQTAPYNGKGQDGIYLAGTAKTLDPSLRIRTGGIAALDPDNGRVRIPAGTAKTLDPSLRIRTGGIAALDPDNGRVRIPAGTTKTLDPSLRIRTGGIAALDPDNGRVRIPAGGAKALDPSGWIQGVFTSSADGMLEYLPAGVRPTIDPSRGVGAFFNPADEMYEYVPAGHAVALDPSGRIRGIALVNLANGSTVRIKAVGTTGKNPDDEHNSSLISSIVKKPRRPKEK